MEKKQILLLRGKLEGVWQVPAAPLNISSSLEREGGYLYRPFPSESELDPGLLIR